MFAAVSSRTFRRHDVRRGVNPHTFAERFVQYAVVELEVEFTIIQFTKVLSEQFPRFDSVKTFEENYPKKQFVGSLFAPVCHTPDQVLAYAVRSPICVSKFEG